MKDRSTFLSWASSGAVSKVNDIETARTRRNGNGIGMTAVRVCLLESGILETNEKWPLFLVVYERKCTCRITPCVERVARGRSLDVFTFTCDLLHDPALSLFSRLSHFLHKKRKQQATSKQKRKTMKLASSLALASTARGPFHPAPPRIPSPSSSLRGAAAGVSVRFLKSSTTARSRQRALRRPDEACCWTDDPDNDDTANAVPCTPGWLANCNNAPACAAYEHDAIYFGSTFCSTWTVWNNEEPDCQWQYMCCN